MLYDFWIEKGLIPGKSRTKGEVMKNMEDIVGSLADAVLTIANRVDWNTVDLSDVVRKIQALKKDISALRKSEMTEPHQSEQG